MICKAAQSTTHMNNSNLLKTYSSKSNYELIEILNQSDEYTEEAKQTLNTVIEQRGGVKKLKENFRIENRREKEWNSIMKKIKSNLKKGKSKLEIFALISPVLFTNEEVEEIYTTLKAEHEEIEDNKKITFKSLLGGIIGGLIGNIVGGIIWGLMLVGSGYIFTYMVLALALISYFFVWLFSRKNKQNVATIILTILSVFLAVEIGQIWFEMFAPLKEAF